MNGTSPARFRSTRGRVWSGCFGLRRIDGGALGTAGLELRVDVDGPDPLGVLALADPQGSVLLGRVWRRHGGKGERLRLRARIEHDESQLELEGPRELDVVLSRGRPGEPEAELRLLGAEGRTLSAWRGERAHAWFRRIEVQVDRERGARALPAYHTHEHPDRPDALEARSLTLEGAYGDAGVRLELEPSPVPIASPPSGTWSTALLHDAMVLHFRALAARPQWTLWMLLARRYERSRIAGLMFDTCETSTDGHSRRGIAIFTECAYFHRPEGVNAAANPPRRAAARRELLLDAVHELGHAMSLRHSFERASGSWVPPPWFEPLDGSSPTWMGYPNMADPELREGARWFYRRFWFRFHRQELLVLRHAPERSVIMGGEPWFATPGPGPEPGVELRVRGLSRAYALGEPVILGLELCNRAGRPLLVLDALEPGDGSLELEIIRPGGERRAWRPFVRARTIARIIELVPGASIEGRVDLTVGAEGRPFAEAGPHRVVARVTHPGGRTSEGATVIEVRSPNADAGVARVLLEAEIGRVLHCRGTGVLHEALAKLRWASERLEARHPLALHVERALHHSAAQCTQHTLARDPATASVRLCNVLVTSPELAAETLGSAGLRALVIDCAAQLELHHEPRRARRLLATFDGLRE